MLKLNRILRYTKEWCYNYNLVYPFTFYERGQGNRILKKLRAEYYNEYKNEINGNEKTNHATTENSNQSKTSTPLD